MQPLDLLTATFAFLTCAAFLFFWSFTVYCHAPAPLPNEANQVWICKALHRAGHADKCSRRRPNQPMAPQIHVQRSARCMRCTHTRHNIFNMDIVGLDHRWVLQKHLWAGNSEQSFWQSCKCHRRQTLICTRTKVARPALWKDFLYVAFANDPDILFANALCLAQRKRKRQKSRENKNVAMSCAVFNSSAFI